jgi:hypothetical protein
MASAPPFDPLALPHHRIHVSTDDTGYRGHCTCGWTTCRPSRDERQRDIDAHRAVPRSRGVHGVVSEGD